MTITNKLYSYIYEIFQPINAPLATSTPKPKSGKGKDKADLPPDLTIRRISTSDDASADPQSKGRRQPFSNVESVFYKHLRQQGITNELLKTKK